MRRSPPASYRSARGSGSFRLGHRPLVAAVALVAGGLCAEARALAATDCEPSNGVSPCIDSNNLWIAPGTARFVSIAATDNVALHASAFAFALSYLDRPIVLRAPSPDPDGRDINVVRRVLDGTALWAYSPLPRLELGFALPIALYQNGSGVEGISDQQGRALNRTAIRDPRIGGALQLLSPATAGFGAKARLEVSLPAGDQDLLAGERSVVAAPSVAFELVRGRFASGLELGTRLRETRRFAGARLGSQLAGAAGASVELLPEELLAVGSELRALPTLASQEHTRPNGARVRNGRLVPAEWLVSLRSKPAGSFVLQLAGALGVPLSSAEHEEPDGSFETEHFAGVTTPRFRIVFVVRYAPVAD